MRPQFRKRLALFCKNDMNLAAKEKIDELFPLAASPAFGFVFTNAGLSETRVGVPNFEKQALIGAEAWLSSTPRWGCGYRCEGTASVSLVQRFYASSYGRFNTPDPYGVSANTAVPGSMNRYSYTKGDPINRKDPRGLDPCPADDPCTDDGGEWTWGGLLDGFWESLGTPVNNGPGYAYYCAFDPECQTQMAQGGGSAPLPTCTPDQLVGGVIEADAHQIGLNINGLSASVQLVGAPCTPGTSECGKNGTYTQTELNLTGNVNGLFNQLTVLNGSQFNCNPGSGLLNVFIGPPHNLGPGGTTNCRQVGPTNSLQVNVNVANGIAQLDIDPYNPAALFGLGSILHGIFQVLPNTINGTDSNYASIAQALKISLNCQF